MNKQEIHTLAKETAKNIKSEHDLNEFNEFRQMLTKITVVAARNAELDEHLGYSKHEKANLNNSRNSFSSKTIQTEDGQFEINTPRDRNGDFEP